MANNSTLVIRDVVALQRWRHQVRSVMLLGRLPTVEFQLPHFSTEWNRSFSKLAGGYQRACGCASSGLFMSLAVIATLASHFVLHGSQANVELRDVLALAGITVIAALVGKALGLMWARWRLLRLAARVHHTIDRPHTPQ